MDQMAEEVRSVEELPHFHAVELLKRDERPADADALEPVPVGGLRILFTYIFFSSGGACFVSSLALGREQGLEHLRKGLGGNENREKENGRCSVKGLPMRTLGGLAAIAFCIRPQHTHLFISHFSESTYALVPTFTTGVFRRPRRDCCSPAWRTPQTWKWRWRSSRLATWRCASCGCRGRPQTWCFHSTVAQGTLPHLELPTLCARW